jgi:hypothetical protein
MRSLRGATATRQRRRWRGAGRVDRLVSLLAAATLLVSLAPRLAHASGHMSLQDANRRWRGARCRSLQEISVKRGQDRHGVSKSRWLWWDQKGGNHRARLYFENADALEPRFRNRVLPAGTEFTVIGWAEDKRGGNVFLEVEVAGLPVRARLFYWDDWVGKVGKSRLDDFERWVRFKVFQILETPDEEIIDVSSGVAGSPVPVPVPAPATAAPVAKPAAPAGPPGLRILAVSVEPVRVVPGAEVFLVVTYGVDGVPPGATLEVTERRSIVQDGRMLTTVEEVVRRPAGVHQSKQPIRLPAGLSTGVYELRATVRAGTLVGEGSAMFEVTSNAR